MPTKDTIHWAAATQSGTRKPVNDDSWIVFSSNAKGAQTLDSTGTSGITANDLVIAVSDGMGGGKAGDIASFIILERMAHIIPETFKAAAAGFFPDSIAHLQTAIKSVHDHINQAAALHDDHKGMAATLALAWFTPENLYITNVGDSRIYLNRRGHTQQITKDHTSAWSQWKRGQITEIEYRTHPRRAALYEVVGGGHENVNPHFAAIPYQTGDRLLVCSDGLIDGLWERHIHDALTNSPDPATTTNKLLQRSTQNAGTDDTTLVTIHIS